MATEKKDYDKPVPLIEKWSQPFWDSIKTHRPLIRKCKNGHVNFPYTALCGRCGSHEHQWVPLSGKGTIFSFAIYYQLWHSGWKDDVPYNAVLVELDEGIQVPGDVVGIKNEEIDVGMRVEMAFDDVTPEVTIWHFQPLEPLQFAAHPLGRRYRYEDRPKPRDSAVSATMRGR